MSGLKKCEIFIGVKAEQSLRDAVRAASEADESSPLELTPVGRKDWIAGMRLTERIFAGEIEPAFRDVYLKLIALSSLQRIRAESIHLYVVQPHVPVFLDADVSADGARQRDLDPHGPSDLNDDDDDTDFPPPVVQPPVRVERKSDSSSPRKSTKGGPAVCPVCQRTVHSYNLHYSTNGKIVGCFLCGGRAGGF